MKISLITTISIVATSRNCHRNKWYCHQSLFAVAILTKVFLEVNKVIFSVFALNRKLWAYLEPGVNSEPKHQRKSRLVGEILGNTRCQQKWISPAVVLNTPNFKSSFLDLFTGRMTRGSKCRRLMPLHSGISGIRRADSRADRRLCEAQGIKPMLSDIKHLIRRSSCSMDSI